MMTDCPICCEEVGHANHCVVGELQALDQDGRAEHERAWVLVLLYTSGRTVTLRELEETTKISFYRVGQHAHALMEQGLVYPHFGHPPAIALTSAPHVVQACEAAADLLGMVFTPPHFPTVSPVLRRHAQ